MANFLEDNSNLGAAAGAFKGFAEAFRNAKDDETKRQEAQARLAAAQAQQQREQIAQDIQMHNSGLQKGPGGGLIEAPLGPKQRGDNMLKAFGEGAQISGVDDNGNPTGYIIDKNTPKWESAKNAGIRGNVANERLEETRNQHGIEAGNKIDEDSLMKQMQNARYSLSRGKALLTGKMPLTMNNLNAVQQDVINGMTSGGQSSEGKVSREMQESWAGRWNDAMAKAGKYGPDNDIRTQDPGLFKQIQGLLEEVDGTIGKNMADRFERLSKNYGQSTNKKVQATIKDKRAQYSPIGGAGLVNEGLVTPAPAQQAAAAAVSHPKADAALDWANKNPGPKADAIKLRLGVK